MINGSRQYAVFIRKNNKWIKESIEFADYNHAQEHAKLVRKLRIFAEKTRVRKI